MEKNILATLQIADHEVRLLVGQFFNGRLNILKVERLKLDVEFGTRDKQIQEAIRKVIVNASRNLETVIHSVLLVVDGDTMQRVRKRIDVETAGRVGVGDIKRAYQGLNQLKGPDQTILVNKMISKFIVNGISTRKFPVGEHADKVSFDVDLYYGDMDTVFSLVSCVEGAGLKIIDLVFDDIGFGKEASLFEASIATPIVSIFIEEAHTRLSFFYQGTFMSEFVMDGGMGQFIDLFVDKYRIPRDVAERFVYYNTSLNQASFSDDPIFMWSTSTKTHTLSLEDVNELVDEAILSWVDTIIEGIEPIRDFTAELRLVVSGAGSQITGLKEQLSEKMGLEVEIYASSTFGLKDACMNATVGAFYHYKDNEQYRDASLCSVDMRDFEQNVIEYNRVETQRDVSLTQKLKSMFFVE